MHSEWEYAWRNLWHIISQQARWMVSKGQETDDFTWPRWWQSKSGSYCWRPTTAI